MSQQPRAAAETLLDRLRAYVVGGEVVPGSLLTEAGLAERFDVSRTPVREALKQLQIEGLVEIRPKVGTFVRQPSRREIVEMFQVKEALEGMAASLMAGRGACSELEMLEANLETSERAVSLDDTQMYAQCVHEFHQILVAGADNARLADHYRTLMNQLAYHRLVLGSLSQPNRKGYSLHEHVRVVDLIRAKDAHSAEWAMRDHVVTSSREALQHSVEHDADPA